MRILVLSDTHGTSSYIEQALEQQPLAKHVIFCGDGLNDFQEIETLYPDRTFYKVCGNCDWFSAYPATGLLTLGGKTIFFTHGHLYHAKTEMRALIHAAKEHQSDILLFGHTHRAYQSQDNGITILNPGSAGRSTSSPSYGYLDITDDTVETHIVYF